MWLTDGQTGGRTDERHTIIRPNVYFGRLKIRASEGITRETLNYLFYGLLRWYIQETHESILSRLLKNVVKWNWCVTG